MDMAQFFLKMSDSQPIDIHIELSATLKDRMAQYFGFIGDSMHRWRVVHWTLAPQPPTQVPEDRIIAELALMTLPLLEELHLVGQRKLRNHEALAVQFILRPIRYPLLRIFCVESILLNWISDTPHNLRELEIGYLPRC